MVFIKHLFFKVSLSFPFIQHRALVMNCLLIFAEEFEFSLFGLILCHPVFAEYGFDFSFPGWLTSKLSVVRSVWMRDWDPSIRHPRPAGGCVVIVHRE